MSEISEFRFENSPKSFTWNNANEINKNKIVPIDSIIMDKILLRQICFLRNKSVWNLHYFKIMELKKH